MARIPGAIWVGEQSPGRLMSRYDIYCIHTIVGRAPAHAAHVSVAGSGLVYQSRDTRFQSGANLFGNPRIIASENEDHGEVFNQYGAKDGKPSLPEWVPLTPEQIEANAQIFAFLHHEHGIPLQLCPDSRRGSRGLAYHRQGIDGNFGPGTDYPNSGRVADGEVWTVSRGKVCPTDVRINQLPLILKRAIEIAYPTPEDPMAEYADQLDRIESIVKKNADAFAEFRTNSLKRERQIRSIVQSLLKRARADDAVDQEQVDKLNEILETLGDDDTTEAP